MIALLALAPYTPTFAERVFISAFVAIIGGIYFCFIFDLLWPEHDDRGPK